MNNFSSASFDELFNPPPVNPDDDITLTEERTLNHIGQIWAENSGENIDQEMVSSGIFINTSRGLDSYIGHGGGFGTLKLHFESSRYDKDKR